MEGKRFSSKGKKKSEVKYRLDAHVPDGRRYLISKSMPVCVYVLTGHDVLLFQEFMNQIDFACDLETGFTRVHVIRQHVPRFVEPRYAEDHHDAHVHVRASRHQSRTTISRITVLSQVLLHFIVFHALVHVMLMMKQKVRRERAHLLLVKVKSFNCKLSGDETERESCSIPFSPESESKGFFYILLSLLQTFTA